MTKKTLFYAVFFIVLLTILFLYNKYNKYNAKIVLPVLSYVNPFAFTDQNNNSFTNKTMEGKIWVVSYFFTSCKGICPNLNTALKTIAIEFKNDTNVKIITHTCQPEKDSIAVLKKYAADWEITPHQWYFVTGNKNELYYMARQSYLLDDPNNNRKNISDDFIHTQFFALVDKEGQIRGQIYDGLKQSDLKLLADDIRNLEKE
ncbi:MAG: SCO family protein [Alphaproteobacteria bacterium]|nr:SCO family protein [Alphaproteobacteria bacterium]